MKNKIMLLSLLFLASLQSETALAIITHTEQRDVSTKNLQETAHHITAQMQQLFAGIMTLFQQGASLEKIEDAVEETTAEVLEEVAAEIIEEAIEEATETPAQETVVLVQTTAPSSAQPVTPVTDPITHTELQNNITALLQETQQKLTAMVPDADSKTLEDISHQLLAMLETVKTVAVRRPIRAIDFNAWNQLVDVEEQTRQAEDDDKEQDEE